MTRLKSVNATPACLPSADETHPHSDVECAGNGPSETIAGSSIIEIIRSLENDLSDVTSFYSITLSAKRHESIKYALDSATKELDALSYSSLDLNGKVDFISVKSFIRRQSEQIDFDEQKLKSMQPLLLVWAACVECFFQQRQQVLDVDWRETAESLCRASSAAQDITLELEQDRFQWHGSRSLANRAAQVIGELKDRLDEAFEFYRDYHPLATWWLTQPCESLSSQLEKLQTAVKTCLVGVKPGDEDAIIGDPTGREALLADIRSELLVYSPEELVRIGETEYQWCEAEMKKASAELGHGQEWRNALETVKNMYPAPGEQPFVVQKLAREAADYVRKADLATVPRLCEETRRTFMMTPERQKANPFFLGGTNLIISYPTSSMDHESKMMAMRGNSIAFSKATVFHELIPGHHLQYHYLARYNTHRRKIFDTPFWMEGWALYWEFIFWERGDFFVTPEERIGTLFWRMHRCARIIFSIKFHLGLMSAQECVDFLVAKVGHERATAEGEVRRSFNGDYRPLYQAAYMLGALQLRQLRHELVDTGKVNEKDFHDRILRANQMSIDMLRALLTNAALTPDYEPTWRFYDKQWHSRAALRI